MEAQSCSLHIVYFLSREGKIEHPHLIRVHHLSTNGVRLRDVKRWFGELRGMSMPDSFSWSYKRRYKTGYVWQDLVDEDLITPISDDEYVLKGSETCSSTTFKDKNFTKTTINDQFLQVDSKTTASNEENHHSDIVSTKSKQQSESSTVTEESDKMEKTSSKSLTHRNKYHKKNAKKDGYFIFSNKATRSSDDSNISPSEPQLSKKSKSNVLHKFITCGPLDTNASAVNKQKHSKNNEPNFLNMCLSDLRNMVRASAEICKGDQLTTPKSTQQRLLPCQRAKDSLKSKNELRKQRTPSAAYLPVNVPNCSQCGKPLISGQRNEIQCIGRE